MTFFYNLNKTLDAIREKPETTHGQLNERDMGKHNNAVTGFKAVADKAAKEYGSKAAGERVAGKIRANKAKAGTLEENAGAGYSPQMQARIKAATPQQLAQMAQELAGGGGPRYNYELKMLQQAKAELSGVTENAGAGYSPQMQARIKAATPQQLAQMAQELAGGGGPRYNYELKMLQQAKAELSGQMEEGFVDAVKSGAQAALGAIGSTMGHGSDEDMIKKLQKDAGLPVTGKVPPQQPGQQPTTAGQQPVAEGEEEDKILAAKIRKMLPAYHKRMEPEDAYQEVAEYLGISVERLYDVLEVNEGVDKQAFAALAPPTDKITFADKIAGAKKEVDEMLGDVAAEAMKSALSGGQKKLDRNKDGKISGQDFAMMRKGRKQVADEGFPTVAGARDEMRKRKVGDVTHGAKHDTQEIPGGRRVTRRLDPNTGYSVGSDKDDEGNAKSTEKKGRGRPKKADKAPERVTSKAYKHKGGRKEKVEEGPDEGNDLVKLSKVIASCKTKEQLLAAQKMANNFLAKHVKGGISNIRTDVRRRNDVDDTLQQKNRELQGGVEEGSHYGNEKLANAKASRSGTSTVRDQDGKGGVKTTTTKTPAKKKEKTEETTTAGSVAPAAGGKAKGGSIVGKGIYDSLNRDLEAMISESMNVSVSMNMDEHGEPRKSITISADGDAAEQLAQLLNLAGMEHQSSEESCGTCGEAACHCDETMVDENSPDWPTDQETIGNDDPLMRRYAGGVNGPKSTGQTTGSPYNRQDSRQGVMGESAVSDIGMKLYAELKSFKG